MYAKKRHAYVGKETHTHVNQTTNHVKETYIHVKETTKHVKETHIHVKETYKYPCSANTCITLLYTSIIAA